MAGYRTIALTVSSAVFMQFLDATALNTALPAMGRDLHVPAVSLNVAILAYQLALAAFIPVGNIAADRMGARNAFAASLLVFLAGSLLCAGSESLPQLIAARAFQGLGGAVMMPVSRQLVVRSAHSHELVSAMNWLLIPGIVGPLMGPVIGGLMVTYASWHWIFLINIPVGLLGIGLTLALVPNDAERGTGHIDVKGVLLIAAAVSSLVFGLSLVAHPHAGMEAGILIVTGALFALVYIRHAAGNPSAAVDLSLLKISSFRHSMVAGSMLRTIVGAIGFLVPLWFQLAMGMSAAQSGMLTVASAGGALCCRFLASPVMRRIHPRSIAIGGTVCAVPVLLLLSALNPGIPRPVFLGVLFIQGLATAFPLMIISAVAYVDIPAERLGAATGFYTTIQQLTMSLGVTAGVWAVGAMHWFAGDTPSDSLTYRGGFIMLAVFAAMSIYAAGQISHGSLSALRKQRGAA